MLIYAYIYVETGHGRPDLRQYYAEQADGTGYLTGEYRAAKRFASPQHAEMMASTLAGARVRFVHSDGWRPVVKREP